MRCRVAALHRYPVKGLSPEPLVRAVLEEGGYFPGDRLFAIENGPSGFDPSDPRHQPKSKFLMLMRNEGLARLRTRYEDATGQLVIAEGGREVARGALGSEAGRAAIAAFFQAWASTELRAAATVLAAPPGFRFTDSRRGFVSIINLASIAALEDRLGVPVDPLRFRGNLHVHGLEPWAEFALVGHVLRAPSGARLRVLKRIERCAATNVDPVTGLRDLQIPQALWRHYGHCDCGIYAEVLSGGPLAVGDPLEREAPAQAN